MLLYCLLLPKGLLPPFDRRPFLSKLFGRSPQLFSIVPTSPRRSLLRWSARTLTRLPICASSDSTRMCSFGDLLRGVHHHLPPTPSFPFPREELYLPTPHWRFPYTEIHILKDLAEAG